jgi:4-hydroxyphenylacetate 3-monooxygenase
MMIEATATPCRPPTGQEYLESLRDGREVWIYGQRVPDVTSHPAFRNQARMVARLYAALHDPASQAQLTCATDTGSGGYTHRFFKASRTVEELLAAREAIATWQRIGYGWMGRSPDFVAAFLGMLGPNTDLYAPYQANAQRWYKLAQEGVPYVNHAIANPPVDRRLAPDEADKLYIHVVKETDAGLIVSGAKNITTNAALTNYSFVAGDGGAFVKNKAMAVLFMTPMNAPGVKVICRPSYEMTASVMGSPFDYPLSSRFDENDAIFILDNVLVPWENVLIYGDANKYNNHMQESGMYHRVGLQACTRLAVKLDLIAGLLLQAVEATGVDQFRGVQVNLGEVITWRHLFWSLSDAMVHSVTTLNGAVIPKLEHLMSYRMLMATAYPRIKEITQQLVASGLIYQPSSALDFKTPELRPYLDHYVRGASNGEAGDAVARIKLMRTLWDALSSEFGGRHELYERNHSGNHEAVRLHPLFHAMSNGTVAQLKNFANQCMAEVDLDGWTAPDLINPHDVNFFQPKGQPTVVPQVAWPTHNGVHPPPPPIAVNAPVASVAPAAGPTLTAAERHKILVEWNNTATAYPKDKCIHHLFEAQAERTPDGVAVVMAEDKEKQIPSSSLTYRELNERANQLAKDLQALGVGGTLGAETLVGICVERSLALVVGLLGIFKAGGAYVPLDPHYPPERLAFILQDAAPAVVITQACYQDRFAERTPLVLLDRDPTEVAQPPRVSNGDATERTGPASNNLAYVIYTSGSTGQPKGALLEHGGLINLAHAQIGVFGLQPGHRVLQVASLNFDASIWELVMALCSGATLVLASAAQLLPGAALTETIRTQAITHITLVPSALALLDPAALPTLQTVVVAGEACSAALAARWTAHHRFFNAYGPTETTVCSTIMDCSQWQERGQAPPIGRPLANLQVYILDEQNQPLPSGVAGQLCVSGVGLARGYHNRPTLTAEKFIDNPFEAGRLYKTGDLCRWLPDGTIEFLGRIDQQVKMRGFRIELGEIESVLSQHPAIQQAVVVTRGQATDEKQLVAYLVQAASDQSQTAHAALQPAALRSYLQTKLPDYMLPGAFVRLETMPLTPNGKIDRAALPEPTAVAAPAERPIVLPSTPTEQVIATIWQEVLATKAFGIHDPFIDLGGHSLQATQVVDKMRKIFQVDFPLSRFFAQPTIAGLSELLQEYESAPGRTEKLARLQQRLNQLG